MPITEHLERWLLATPSPHTVGEVTILSGWELRHHLDQAESSAALTHLPDLAALREIVKTTAEGVFRPLRGSPTLRSGWRMGPLALPALIEALNLIYPTALGLWVQQKEAMLRITEFAETSQRQTGMYRLTQVLTSAQLAHTVATVCGEQCLRQRLWAPSFSYACAALPDKKSEGMPLPGTPLPLLCAEGCNYFIAQARAVIMAEREKEKQRGKSEPKS